MVMAGVAVVVAVLEVSEKGRKHLPAEGGEQSAASGRREAGCRRERPRQAFELLLPALWGAYERPEPSTAPGGRTRVGWSSHRAGITCVDKLRHGAILQPLP